MVFLELHFLTLIYKYITECKKRGKMFKKLFNRLFIATILIFSVPLSANPRTIYAATLSSSYEPWSYLDKDSQYQGYNIDVLREIAKRLNYDLVIGEISQELFLRTEKSSAYDVYLGLVSPSIEKQINFFFSSQYIKTPYRFVVHKDFYDQYASDAEQIESFSDLIKFFEGKTIYVINKSTSETLARHYFKLSTISPYFIKNKVFEDFDKKLRAFLLDSSAAEAKVKNEQDKYYLFGPEIDYESINEIADKAQTFAFPITQRRLQILFDQTLSVMEEDGTLAQLSQKHFGKNFITDKKSQL